MMDLVREGLLRYTARWNPAHPGIVHVRLFRDTTHAVAVVGQLNDNPGPSVTNSWETLFPLIEELADLPVTFVEYYAPDELAKSGEYDVVWLKGNEVRWQPLDRDEVELLIGQRLEVLPSKDYHSSQYRRL